MTIDRKQWPALETENQAELLAYLGTAACAESFRAAHLSWVITGVDSNDYNGVIWARLDDDQADQLVPALVQQFRDRGLPALWQLDLFSQPADLPARLDRLGCARLDSGYGMGMPLINLPGDTNALPNLTIERVTTLADLAAWMDVWTHDGEETRAPREQLYATLGLDGALPLRHYLARLNGEPVGVAQLFLGQESAGVYCVAVLPEFRRIGIGTALTLTVLHQAQALSYSMAVLGPSPEGELMYRRLGFELFESPFVGYTLWHEPPYLTA